MLLSAVKPEPTKAFHSGFRDDANTLNPSSAVADFDSWGRPDKHQVAALIQAGALRSTCTVARRAMALKYISASYRTTW